MNMLEEYKRVAARAVEDFKANPLVEGIMHLGGIARGFADEDSDIDLAIFSKQPLEGVVFGEQITPEGYDLELWNVVMDEGTNNWSTIQKEAYQEGYIEFDRHGNVAAFLETALRIDEDERIYEILRLIFKIAWHGWIYTPFRNELHKGYHWILPVDLWHKRNRPENGYYLARVCVEDFIEMLFHVNRRHVPDYKWRWIKSEALAILPKRYSEQIRYLLFEAWNESTWETKRAMFQGMIDDIVPSLIEELPEDWYRVIEG